MTILEIYAEGWRRMIRYYIFSVFLLIVGLPAYAFIYGLFHFRGINVNKAIIFSDDPVLFTILVSISILYCPLAFYLASEATNQFKAKLRERNTPQNNGIETDAD